MIKEYNKIKDAIENLQKLKTLTAHLSNDKKENETDMVNLDLEYLKDIEIPLLKPKVKIKFKNVI